jgi:plastin-1
MDGECYVILLNEISPHVCDKSGLSLDGEERASKIITDARKLGVPPCIKAIDITSGEEPKLNLLHCAHIFNNCPGLTPTEEEKTEAAGLIDDDNDPEASREERGIYIYISKKKSFQNVDQFHEFRG